MKKLLPEELKIRIAQNKEDLKQAKVADDLAFGKHHGITMEELELLIQYGRITLVVLKGTNQVIAQTQTLFCPIAPLPYKFDSNVAYGYGRGVIPEFQKQGLSKLLALQEELNARYADKNRIAITIRVENYNNLRARLNEGFIIVDYIPDFYGPGPEDARLLLRKHLDLQRTPVTTLESITIPVSFGDTYDPIAHQHIMRLMANGFQGISISKEGITFVRTF